LGGAKGGGGKGGEMTQTLYAHMNKIKIKKKKRSVWDAISEKKLSVVDHACHPSDSGKPKIGKERSRLT
jgi:hypothetical protein